MSYADYFLRFRSPFHLTYESLVVGFTIAWLSLHVRIGSLNRAARETLFWGGAASVLYWMVPAVILQGIHARTIVWAPSLVGLGFGAMVLAAVSGGGSYSAVFGWTGWRPIATGSYTLYLTHMMVIPLATALTIAYPITSRMTIVEQWIAFLPWYVALSALSAFLLHRFVEKPVLLWRDRYLHTPVARSAAIALESSTELQLGR